MLKRFDDWKAARQQKIQEKWITEQRTKILSHPLIEQLHDTGIKFVLLDGFDFKLEGKIRWQNTNGTTTVLEEHGTIISGLDGFITLARHYLNNANKYTNFIEKHG